MWDIVKAVQERFHIIGRGEELHRALLAAAAGKHILFEGPVGVGKTVIASALAEHLNRQFYRIDGDERYTEQKLVGWFDPPLVIAKGYSLETFIPGPLTQAMMDGAFLFINELNRMPEGTQNVLLPAMDERQITIPKIGALKAKPGFLIIATQNPEEFVGTSRLGEALRDRFVWISLNYQSEEEEKQIVKKETGCSDEELIAIAVKIARKTREEPEIRRGASVRGAIDIVDLINRMPQNPQRNLDTWVAVAVGALGTKIELLDQANQRMESTIKRIVSTIINEYDKTRALLGEKQKRAYVAETRGQETKPTDLKRMGGAVESALGEGSLQPILELYQRDPSSVAKILQEGDAFERLVKVAEHTQVLWPAIQLLYLVQSNSDPASRSAARRSLIRLIARLAAQISGRTLGPTEYHYTPLKAGVEEFEIDQTMENMLGKTLPDPQDIISIEKRKKMVGVTLILDTSNSMQTQKIIMAVLAVSAIAHKLRDDYYAVVTFKENAQVIKSIMEKPYLEGLIDKMLNLQPGGLTNIEEALNRGLKELERLDIHDRAGILVTDGWVTTGGDPAKEARQYPRLHVIQVPFTAGGGDFEMCRRLAEVGRGRYYYARGFQELPRAIIHILK